VDVSISCLFLFPYPPFFLGLFAPFTLRHDFSLVAWKFYS
jgi:hypothetical protein